MSGFAHSHQYSNEHYAYIHASQPQQYVFKVVTSPYPDTAPSTPEFINTPSPSPSSSSSRSDEFSSTSDPSRKKNHIPRPLNCYFIFRKDVVDKNLIPKGAEHDSRHLSRIIGQLWKNLSEDEKAHYYRRALEERKRHEELYPDYVFQPQKRATEIRKRNVKRKSKDHINRAKDIAHLMSTGMTGSDLEDAVRNMPPIPKTPQVQPPKKRVSQQQARSPIHAQPTVPKPYMCRTEATEHQSNSSTLPMNSPGDGHFFSAAASFETEYMVHFEIPTNGYFDNQSPLSEINYCLAMSSSIYDNTVEFNATYDSSYPTISAPHIF